MTTSSSPSPLGAAVLRAYRGVSPRIDPAAWIAPGAIVVGDVEIGAESSIWYGTLLRHAAVRVP